MKPRVRDGDAGVTTIDTSEVDVTVRIVEPLAAPEVAVIVDVPGATPVARPALSIVTAPVLLLLHAAVAVMLAVPLV